MGRSSLAEIRAALAANDLRALERGFDPEDDTHVATLLALTSAERRAMLGRPVLVQTLNVVSGRLLGSGRFLEALTILDDAIEADRHHDLTLYVNALWGVQNDNHRLGLMPERAGRYLQRCLPYAKQAPALFFNASCVSIELGDLEGALALAREAVRSGYDRCEAMVRDLAALSGDPRFGAVATDDTLLRERQAMALPRGQVDWARAFGKARPERGATEPELSVLRDLWAPVDDVDVARLHEDVRQAASTWVMHGFLPPVSYLDFLRYSNGGSFEQGERTFNGFFPAHTLRWTMLQYGIPEEMPSVLPFAFDGGGVFYAFDMRQPPVEGEFPIVTFHASTPVWEETVSVAASFEELCRGTTRV